MDYNSVHDDLNSVQNDDTVCHVDVIDSRTSPKLKPENARYSNRKVYCLYEAAQMQAEEDGFHKLESRLLSRLCKTFSWYHYNRD